MNKISYTSSVEFTTYTDNLINNLKNTEQPLPLIDEEVIIYMKYKSEFTVESMFDLYTRHERSMPQVSKNFWYLFYLKVTNSILEAQASVPSFVSGAIREGNNMTSGYDFYQPYRL